MRAPRLGEHGNERAAASRCQRTVKRFGGGAVGRGFAQHNAPLTPLNREGDAPKGRRFAVYEGKIAFLNFSFLHRKRKAVCRKRVLGDKDGTAGFAVEPRDGAEHEGRAAVAMRKRVCKRILKMPV